MLNLNSLMLGSQDPQKLSDFYTKVIGKAPDMTEDNWFGWSVGACFFSLGFHSEVQDQSKEPARIMFTFETTEVQSEFDRILALGAKEIKAPYSMGGMLLATLADPDGNYFQLMTPWKA